MVGLRLFCTGWIDYLTCLKPRYITRISCRVNFVCLQRSSNATGRCFGTLLGSISNTISSMGLSGGVAIVNNYIYALLTKGKTL